VQADKLRAFFYGALHLGLDVIRQLLVSINEQGQRSGKIVLITFRIPVQTFVIAFPGIKKNVIV
jgi:hypothetical protein